MDLLVYTLLVGNNKKACTNSSPSFGVCLLKMKAMGSLFVGGSSMLSQSSLSQSNASQLNTTTAQVRLNVPFFRCVYEDCLKVNAVRFYCVKMQVNSVGSFYEDSRYLSSLLSYLNRLAHSG